MGNKRVTKLLVAVKTTNLQSQTWCGSPKRPCSQAAFKDLSLWNRAIPILNAPFQALDLSYKAAWQSSLFLSGMNMWDFLLLYHRGRDKKIFPLEMFWVYLKCIYQDVYKFRPYITQLHLSSKLKQIKSNANLPGLKIMQLHDATNWLQSSKILDEKWKGNFHGNILLMGS